MSSDEVLEGRSALVTGARGFIGTYLCQSLRSQGINVVGLSRAPAAREGAWDTLLQHDLSARDCDLRLPAVDTVFHLAAHVHQLRETADSADRYRKVNVEGTARLLEAASRARVRRFVYVSTVKVIGESTTGTADEFTPLAPRGAYGETKLAAEQLTLGANGPDFESCVLRLPAVYGAGCKGNLTEMFRRVAAGRFPPIPEFGNLRSMVHVKDVVRALELLAAHTAVPGKAYIVTDGDAVSTRQLYEAMYVALGRRPPAGSVPGWVFRAGAAVGDVVSRLAGVELPIDSDKLEKLSVTACYSDARLRRETGFVPGFTLKAGLSEMLPDVQL